MSVSVIVYLVGMAALYVGERLVGGDELIHRTPHLIALVALADALWLRWRYRRSADGPARAAHTKALVLTCVGIGSLFFYLLSTDWLAHTLELGDESARRMGGVFGALWPAVFLAGTLPLVLVDRAIGDMPRAVQPRRIAVALDTGLVVALAVALAFPLNFLAARHDWSTDLRYLKTTAVGEATRAVATSVTDPLRIVLFFPPANDVGERVRPYFEALAGASESITLEEADQALQPDLARDLRVSSNGTVALVRGEDIERINVGQTLDAARKNLKTLDETVLARLLKLTQKAKVAYFTAGHDEGHWGGRDTPPMRKLAGMKKTLEDLNYRVKDLSLDEGLGREIPEDAALVIIAGPSRPFLPEEVNALGAYLEGGGRLLLLLEAGEEKHESLTGLLGVTFTPEVLHSDTAYLARTRTPADQSLLLTNSYSAHPSVSTLAKFKRRLVLVTPLAGWLKLEAPQGWRLTETVRSRTGTWADLDGDHLFDAGSEQKKVWTIGAAAEQREGEGRAAVLANLAALSDAALANQANFQLLLDTVNWLTGNEALSGTVETEEDVRIEHTRDEDKIYFYGTTVLVPLLIVVAGLVRVSLRRKRS